MSDLANAIRNIPPEIYKRSSSDIDEGLDDRLRMHLLRIYSLLPKKGWFKAKESNNLDRLEAEAAKVGNEGKANFELPHDLRVWLNFLDLTMEHAAFRHITSPHVLSEATRQ